ncbi:MAG: IS1634 family transposase, partial [Acidimicrobiales bacterium]
MSTDGAVPLVSHAYPGNKPDVTQFPVMVAELVGRFGVLFDDGDELEHDRLTLVYDAGQNSEDNYELLDGAPLHFVG